LKYGQDITLETLKAAQPLTEAEELLLQGCDTGQMVELGPPRPDDATDDNTIRAELIRYLLLGGCKNVSPHAKGVQVSGAYVTGVLDLVGCVSSLQLGVVGSRFENAPDLTDCKLGALWLDGSCLPGVLAQRMRVGRSVMLRNGFRAKGLVDLTGSKIGGQLSCSNATFDGDGGPALKAQGLDVVDGVFLRDGFRAKGLVDLNGSKIGGQLNCEKATLDGYGGPALMAQGLDVVGGVVLCDGFRAKGLIDLNGSKIGGQLDCVDATFDGHGDPALMAHGLDVVGDVFLRGDFSAKGFVDLSGSKIGGQLVCANGKFPDGLRLQVVAVTGWFVWQDVIGQVQTLDLNDASVGALVDDWESWKNTEWYDLEGFQYGALIYRQSVEQRLSWLDKSANLAIALNSEQEKHRVFPQDINPQPYTQLARHYDKIGHRREGTQVRLRREQRLQSSRYFRARLKWQERPISRTAAVGATLHALANTLYGAVFGYGFAPFRALFWSAVIVLISAWVFGIADFWGQMAPNSDVVLTSSDWIQAAELGCADVYQPGCQMPLWIWKQSESYKDYETFSALGYGFDLFVPLDALGQEKAWAPSHGRGGWGAVGYWFRWGVQIAGWLITFVSAAVLTGLVGKRD